MTGGGETKTHRAELDPFTIREGLETPAGLGAEAASHDLDGAGCGEHMGAAGPGMIAMAVGHHRALDRPDRIDEEAAGKAAEAARRRLQPFGEWNHGPRLVN